VCCPGTGTEEPWAAVEAMVDNAHGFDVEEKIIAKMRFHQKKEVTWNVRNAARYLSNVLYSTSLHTQSYTG
jgi:hypothetical protein